MSEGATVTEVEETPAVHQHEAGFWHPDCPACPDEPGPWDTERPAGELTPPEDEAEESAEPEEGSA